jgi:hypothetical protein
MATATAVKSPAPFGASAPRSSTPAAPQTRGSQPSRMLAPARGPSHTLQPGESKADRVFVTRDGRKVELPEGMTAAEAAKLEAEASAAQTKLGKGPPPQPVPDVKKLAKKEEKKDKPKPASKSPKGKKPGKTGSRAGKAASAMLKAVGASKVAQYLAAKAGPVLAKGMGALQKLRQNEQTHDNAAEKQAQAEQAVVIPASEGQAKGNTGQVNQVSDRPAPAVDESKGKQKLQESLKENVPKTIEDVDNFQRDKKAQHMGADVMTVVLADKNAVVSTYQDMGQTPPPAPREHEPEALPGQEQAPATDNLNLGKDGIAPLQTEHTDVSSFTNEADAKLKEEGVTQEQLDMVDSGDLAIAKKEKKGMETAAKAEPLAVQKFAQDQGNAVAKELKEEGNKNHQAMKAKRKGDLGVTGNKQKKAKSDLEKKREEVAAKINGIYTAAQDKVKKRLADLETESMKRFDDGNVKATKEFEDSVNREIEAFKDDRYSGWFGWARKAKDWVCGIDEMPEVKAIFDRNRAKFVATIDRLVADIAADNKRVVQECKDELQNARTQIKDYVDKLGPALRDVGTKAAEEMNSKLDELDKFVAKKEEDLQNKLKDKQTAAIKAIDEKIEKMKEAMAGALSKLGKLLLAAAKKFFTWALEKFGVSLSTIEGIINKGAAVLKAIFTQPVKFVKNLMNAAITGFKNFGKNFLKHLQDALFEWLTGSLEGLKLPSTWDLKGIIGIALQMIGISYENIRRHMVTVMTEPVVAGLEKTFTLVKTLVTEGPMAAWEQLKEMAGEMRDAFIDAVKDFIKQKIVEEAIKWVVALFVPGAGLIKAAIGIYDTIVFFIQKAKQIMQMISNFLGSIADIAAGNIGAAADAMENGLARGLSLVISFLAQLLHLNAITGKIKAAIEKIKTKVDAVLLKVAKWIANKAKDLLSRGLGADPNAPPTVRVENALREAVPLVNRYSGRPVGAVILRPLLLPVKLRNRLSRLDVVPQGNLWAVEAAASPAITQLTTAQVPGTGIAGLTSRINYTSGSLAGNVVGQEMVADPLGPDHPMGQEPAGANVWNTMLVTDPAQPNDRKYIRGHLLNHHVGGTGGGQNLFPITALANDRHESQIESRVKQWVNTERKWVFYRVQVTNVNPVINPAGPIATNKIDAHFVCTASVIDANLPITPANRHNTINATIVSEYRPPAGAATVINQSASTQQTQITARPQDAAATIAVPAGEEYKLDQTLYRDLHTIFVTKGMGARHIDFAIQNVTGLGPAITSTLFRAFNLSLSNNRGDIGANLNANEKSNLTRLNNMSSGIHTALRVWL